jgi:hypothetical protein
MYTQFNLKGQYVDFFACFPVVGYDLYGSALADILSEPSLSMPITGREAEVETTSFFLKI